MKHDSHIVETYYTSPVFSNHSHLQQSIDIIEFNSYSSISHSFSLV